MESIEPYDSKEFKEFSIAYLPGFFSEQYDKTKEQVLPLIENKIKIGTNDILRNSINGYSIVDVVGTHENFNKTSNLLAWWGTIYPQFCFMEAPRTENGQKAEPRFHFWIVETLNALM